MTERRQPVSRARADRKKGSPDPEELAAVNYKARLTKGLLGVGLGEGPIVEILNYRTKRVLRRDLFEDVDEARDVLDAIRRDIDSLSIEEFHRKYLKAPG